MKKIKVNLGKLQLGKEIISEISNLKAVRGGDQIAYTQANNCSALINACGQTVWLGGIFACDTPVKPSPKPGSPIGG